jgi:macrodomain Ter protein organizer (MatP/YcbG family)
MKKQILSEEFRRMQKLAGLITENQYKYLVKETTEKASVEKIIDNSNVQTASEKLAQDPALLKKAMEELSKLGIDKNTLVKAAQAHNAGKSVDTIIDQSKIEKASSALTELESPEDILKRDKKGGAKFGGALGAILGFSSLALIGPIALPGALIAAVVVGAIGAKLGSNIAKSDTENSPEFTASKLIQQMGKEKALQYAEEQKEDHGFYGSKNTYERGIDMESFWKNVVDYIKS